MNIGEKIFAYIAQAGLLTSSMVEEYKNSLIFLGDEKQIYIPVTNSYVGIGQTAYDTILNAIQTNGSDLNTLYDHVHQNVVNTVSAQFTQAELEAMIPDTSHTYTWGGETVTRNNYKYQLKANQDMVLKGVNDYDPSAHNTSSYGTSGIKVTLAHDPSGVYRHGTDESGFGYSYWEGQDVMSIDDSLTWAYITNTSSYLMKYATKVATAQANRVFHDILGEDTTVYIEKEFGEAFLLDSITGELSPIGNVYVKMANGSYQVVSVSNDDDGHYYVYLDNDTKVLYTNDNSVTLPSPFTGVYTSSELESLLDSDDGIEDIGGLYVPTWYHIDMAATSSANTKLADGITTLKEVSYILDKLTDGDDAGISLAYNISYNFVEIQKLKKWQDEIGSSSVATFQSESMNPNLVTISYYSSDLWAADKDGAAVGNVKLDIGLRLAQTYEVDGVTYAAYTTAHNANINDIYIRNLDPTGMYNFIQITGANGQEIVDLFAAAEPSSTSTPLYVYDSVGEKYELYGSSVSLTASSINSMYSSTASRYVKFPYTKITKDATDGLTTVDWVTTYVAWGMNDVINLINGGNDTLETYVMSKINALDYTDTAVAGKYVSEVDEEDGVITVTRVDLPLDKILANQVVYTNELMLHITGKEAYDLMTDNLSRQDVFYDNGSSLVMILSTSGIDQSSSSNYYLKTSMSSFTMVSANSLVADMIANAGNVSYFIKTTSNNTSKYTPLDIQETISNDTNNDIFTVDAKVVDDDVIFYLNTSSSTANAKYIDARQVRNPSDGHTDLFVSAYVTYLSASSPTNTGLADAWDVRRTIESMFSWVDLQTNKIIGMNS